MTVLGICIADCWKAFRYYLDRQSADKDMTIKGFASILSKELLENDLLLSVEEEAPFLAVIAEDNEVQQTDNEVQQTPAGEVTVVADEMTAVSALSMRASPTSECNRGGDLSADIYMEKIRAEHKLKKRGTTKHDDGKSRRQKRSKCRVCKNKTRFFCGGCGEPLCEDGSGITAPHRYCHTEHIQELIDEYKSRQQHEREHTEVPLDDPG